MTNHVLLRLATPNILWPVIVTDGNDVMVFSDIHALALKLEPPDVESNSAFDATARKLRLWVSGSSIHIEPLEASDVPDLSRRLKACLAYRRAPASSDALFELLDQVVRVQGFTK